jgi:hypothetical protein
LTPPASIATLCSRGCLYLGPTRRVVARFTLPPLAQYAVRDDWRLESLPRLARWGSLGGANMSNTVHLSDVQLLNLSVLMTIQASIKRDPVTACYRFNLRDDQAQRVEGLGQQQLQAIVANRGEESLFKLRDDFWPLLDAPPGLQVPLSTVRFAGTLATVPEPRSMPRRESA